MFKMAQRGLHGLLSDLTMEHSVRWESKREGGKEGGREGALSSQGGSGSRGREALPTAGGAFSREGCSLGWPWQPQTLLSCLVSSLWSFIREGISNSTLQSGCLQNSSVAVISQKHQISE